ncbi:MAG: ATP-binding cassette domain-containing protein [Chitinophagales bacterium]|jgi:ABC-2 type transport system ATP-binding protein|nr:ATP-binding cassette domain-containing protein [Chitinophagales bacterium]
MDFHLKIDQVSKSYIGTKALDNCSFELKSGEILGLLGPNGAGKSTLLRIITGIYRQDQGRVLLNDSEINFLDNPKLIGYMPEERGLYKAMKVYDQALFFAKIKGLKHQEAKESVEYWFEKLGMMDWKNKKVEEVSKGMAQKLQIVCTLLHKPKFVILDEPFSGLDPLNADLIKNVIFDLSQRHQTCFIFSTHRMEQVEEICDRIVLINQGKLMAYGHIKEIKNQFDEGRYEIKVANIQDFISHSGAAIVSSDDNSALIQLESSKMNDLLRYFIQNPENSLLSLTKKLPSLHDIFIKLVEN